MFSRQGADSNPSTHHTWMVNLCLGYLLKGRGEKNLTSRKDGLQIKIGTRNLQERLTMFPAPIGALYQLGRQESWR